MQGPRRIGWIDWVRALGACAIVLLHVDVSTARAVSVGFVRTACYTAVGVTLCRWAVPAFFMVSGLLLLDPARTVTWKDACRHAGRMAQVLCTFGLLFALMEETFTALSAGAGLSWELGVRAVVDVLTTQTWDHLWYVYALMGVYLLLPLIRAVQAHLGKRGFDRAVAALCVVVLVLPTINAGLAAMGVVLVVAPEGLLATFVRNLLIGLACFCAGGCLRERALSVAWVAVGVGSLAAMLAVSLMGDLAGLGDLSFVFLQGSCFACLYGAFVLLAIRRLVGESPVVPGTLVANLARDSFGIYILHPLFVHVVLMLVDPLAFPPGLYEVVFFLVALGLSVAATRALRHVPVVGDVL